MRALLLGPSGVSSSLGCVDPQLSLICASQREQGSSEGLSLAHACPPPPPRDNEASVYLKPGRTSLSAFTLSLDAVAL